MWVFINGALILTQQKRRSHPPTPSQKSGHDHPHLPTPSTKVHTKSHLAKKGHKHPHPPTLSQKMVTPSQKKVTPTYK